jgi:hypothetical protein
MLRTPHSLGQRLTGSCAIRPVVRRAAAAATVITELPSASPQDHAQSNAAPQRAAGGSLDWTDAWYPLMFIEDMDKSKLLR